MKKRFFLLLLVIFASANDSQSCDICGCGAGNYYFGMMPQFNKNFVGIRYRFSSFQSHIGLSASGLFETKERFQSTEIWARYYPHPKIQLLAFIPYSFNSQTDNTTTRYLDGLNDIVIMGNYNIFRTPQDTIVRVFKHNLLIGGGVKLPTGKHTYTETDLSQVANPNFQLGTGSVDFLLNLAYTIRHKRFGLNADLTCKINTKNNQDYKFGNRVTSNVSLFYIQKIKKFGVMPHVGIYMENSMEDIRQKDTVIDTGGYFVSNTSGLELYYNRFSIGVNYQIPLKQVLANGHIKGEQRGGAHISYVF